MIARATLFLLFLAFCFPLPAQLLNGDSLWKEYNNPAAPDSGRVNAVLQLSTKWAYMKPDSGIALGKMGLKMALEKKLARQEGNAYNQIGVAYNNKGDMTKALEYHTKALEVRERIGDKKGVAASLNNIGIVYYQFGDYSTAIDYYHRSLEIKEAIGDMRGVAASYSNIGIIYESEQEFEKARNYYLIGLRIRDSLQDYRGLADSYNRLGSYYSDKENYDSSKYYVLQSLALARRIDDRKAITNNLSNLSMLFKKKGDIDSAVFYSLEALRLREAAGDDQGICVSNLALGKIALSQENYAEALKRCSKANTIADTLHITSLQQESCNCLARAYEATGNYQLALKFAHLDREYTDSLSNIEKTKSITSSAMQYEFGKRLLADSLARVAKDREKEMEHDREIREQQTYTWAGAGGSVLLLALVFVLLRGYRLKQRNNLALAMKNREVEQQKLIVEEKNQAITDSINYAQRLQEAILPPARLWKQHLPDSFVLYQPKDIVAGDFYWLEVVSGSGVRGPGSEPNNPKQGTRSQELVLFAVADCTGHGVPGALVSVVCSNALNRAVKEFGLTDPGRILDKVTELVLETFERSESSVSDGMDISLCCLDRATLQLRWAGANNPLWIVRDNNLIGLKPDKQPVGAFDNRKPFTTHTEQLRNGDCVYLFSDGYADQFGGPEGKKFKYSQLRELMLSVAARPMAQQESLLRARLDEWKGNLVQVDDVCVAGVKI